MNNATRNRLRSFLVDNVSLILVLVSFALLTLTLRQNWQLRGQLASCASRERAIAGDLERSQNLMQLVGMPMPMASKLRELVRGEGRNEGGYHIVVVFNPTTCGRGLREQLSIVRSFQARQGPKTLAFLGLVGADTLEDKSYALMLRSRDLMSFPFSYTRSRELSRLFPLQAETGFADTPLYLLIDPDFRIRSVFKPDSSKPETLEIWLERRLAI